MPDAPSTAWLVVPIAGPLLLALAAFVLGGRWCAPLGLAAALLVVVATGMTVANLLPAIQMTVLGILLIVAIIATNFIYSRTQR